MEKTMYSDWSSSYKKNSCNKADAFDIVNGKAVLNKLIIAKTESIKETGKDSTEVAILAIVIAEKFFIKHLQEIARVTKKMVSKKDFNEDWKHVKTKILSQLELRIMSCIQLASKMILINGFSGGFIEHISKKNGKSYSLKTILSSELRVFKTIDYSVPLFTAVDISKHIICTVCNEYGLEKRYLTKLCEKVLRIIFTQDAKIQGLNHNCQSGTCNLWNRMVSCTAVIISCRILNGDEKGERVSYITKKIVKSMDCTLSEITLLSDYYMKIIIS